MSKKLENKVVIVTGASKGIGVGIAKQMGASGAKVVVNYASSKEGAEAVVAEIVKSGGNAIAVQGDMSKQIDVKRLFEETVKVFGGLDVLVNNAGIYEFALLETFTEDSYRRMFDINVLSLLLTSQEAVKLFGTNGGSIINISSFASTRPEPYSVVYGATKSAVDNITTSLSQELGPKNIRVNSIRPGGVFTEGVASLGTTEDSDAIKGMVNRSALGRMATPNDIGKMAVFLASDDSSIITGQTIEVSGGFK
ncbi:SDR family NAD(P)-dependent oxidoreductase [Flavobacterium turcicum]|uniref:SDR family oxidoreductase n=1 Tax=Flavobacterium turcicum TaxID=2764718 RepID=A0ABR7JE85_9FLAO|nr:SDR family oxidoreductase [Flavobacterium turcicum]MBC5862813.1 SDR family oxidoreductase [Flavobacterium turcicum]NHL01545.1 SDR family oxidoreductase [Flavobacterium turcicum]